jgi:hypothetical protein
MLVATAVLAAAPTLLAASSARVGNQDGGTPEAQAKDLSGVAKSVQDFIHYVLIGKADLAQAAGEAVLGASISDADLAEAVDGGDSAERLSRAISRSRAMGGVSDLATRIENRVESGRRDLARDPQRIAQRAQREKPLRQILQASVRGAVAPRMVGGHVKLIGAPWDIGPATNLHEPLVFAQMLARFADGLA